MTRLPTHVAADHPARAQRARNAFDADVAARAKAARLEPAALASVVAAHVAAKPVSIDYAPLGGTYLFVAEELETPDGDRQTRVTFNTSNAFGLWMLGLPSGTRDGVEVTVTTIAMTGVTLDDPTMWMRELRGISEALHAGTELLNARYAEIDPGPWGE